MQNVLSILKKHSNTLMKLLPLLPFAVPLLWLYLLDSDSFGLMWKGRTFQLFFIWLIALARAQNRRQKRATKSLREIKVLALTRNPYDLV
jgi:hypothetical protein